MKKPFTCGQTGPVITSAPSAGKRELRNERRRGFMGGNEKALVSVWVSMHKSSN